MGLPVSECVSSTERPFAPAAPRCVGRSGWCAFRALFRDTHFRGRAVDWTGGTSIRGRNMFVQVSYKRAWEALIRREVALP
jgi:hypothetical protein